ncbi:hypothetical protein D1Y84_14715 [Acidipila sp. EB88]|nr:hypothetical protein D1Y84_14715 [Acidipila sp. EB88]
MFIAVVVMFVRHGQAQSMQSLLLGAVAVGTLVFLTLIRSRIQQLSSRHPDINADLRSLSTWSVRLAAAVMIACSLAGSWV